jgi:hypothetical protein
MTGVSRCIYVHATQSNADKGFEDALAYPFFQKFQGGILDLVDVSYGCDIGITVVGHQFEYDIYDGKIMVYIYC